MGEGRAQFLPKFLATLPISAEQRALVLAHRRMDKVGAGTTHRSRGGRGSGADRGGGGGSGRAGPQDRPTFVATVQTIVDDCNYHRRRNSPEVRGLM